ncbi:MAG: PadR family transcriptional regulator [Acidimicrobiia bacterium]
MARPAKGSGAATLRTALLVLLSDRESHGYDLALRLAPFGIEPDMAGLYRTLRSMDRAGDLRSEWSTSSKGPARRVYGLTEEGRRRLQRALDGMEAHHETVERLLSHTRPGRVTR